MTEYIETLVVFTYKTVFDFYSLHYILKKAFKFTKTFEKT